MDSDQIKRRKFFNEALAKLLSPAIDYLEDKFPKMGVDRIHIRPPGALEDEQEFLDTCTRCGACEDVCPVSAIRRLTGISEELDGTPHLDPDIAACVICDDLACIKNCPSGALMPIADISQIRMGFAEVYASACLRVSGEPCRECVDKCPVGSHALRIDGNSPPIVERGCVGCGICQNVCPTLPKAITVKPL